MTKKLTAVAVLEMRSKYASHLYTIGQLAVEYGVSINTASNAIHGYTWKEVEQLPAAESEIEASAARLGALLSSDEPEPTPPEQTPEDYASGIARLAAGLRERGAGQLQTEETRTDDTASTAADPPSGIHD